MFKSSVLSTVMLLDHQDKHLVNAQFKVYTILTIKTSWPLHYVQYTCSVPNVLFESFVESSIRSLILVFNC